MAAAASEQPMGVSATDPLGVRCLAGWPYMSRVPTVRIPFPSSNHQQELGNHATKPILGHVGASDIVPHDILPDPMGRGGLGPSPIAGLAGAQPPLLLCRFSQTRDRGVLGP